MTAHDHRIYVLGCYRCELGRDEAHDAARGPFDPCPDCGCANCVCPDMHPDERAEHDPWQRMIDQAQPLYRLREDGTVEQIECQRCAGYRAALEEIATAGERVAPGWRDLVMIAKRALGDA